MRVHLIKLGIDNLRKWGSAGVSISASYHANNWEAMSPVFKSQSPSSTCGLQAKSQSISLSYIMKTGALTEF
jgi:hypothetical protein